MFLQTGLVLKILECLRKKENNNDDNKNVDENDDSINEEENREENLEENENKNDLTSIILKKLFHKIVIITHPETNQKKKIINI